MTLLRTDVCLKSSKVWNFARKWQMKCLYWTFMNFFTWFTFLFEDWLVQFPMFQAKFKSRITVFPSINPILLNPLHFDKRRFQIVILCEWRFYYLWWITFENGQVHLCCKISKGFLTILARYARMVMGGKFPFECKSHLWN